MSIRNVISLKSLTKKYDEKTIIDNVNYVFLSNNVYGIIGESGCGKTTLMNIIGLIDSFFDGEIIFDEEILNQRKDYYKIRANKIGFIFQSFYLVEELNVKDNILLPLKYSSNDFDEEYYLGLIKKLGLEQIENSKVTYLSGGEKQRVCIARALINKPKLIICDEPTGNLDEENTRAVVNLIKSFINEERTIIIVTHSSFVASNCDKILRIQGGIINEIR